jgi:LPXTG-motif cell wall-anchored protein
MSKSKWFAVALVAVCLVAGGAFAQETKTTVEKVEIEIVHVSGNNVVFLMDGKAVQREMPADFRVMVDGKPVPVSELVPGQKVQVERITKVTPIQAKHIVTVRNGEVVRVAGQTLVYREDNKNKEVKVPKDFFFMVDGKKTAVQNLTPGMKITATIVKDVPQPAKVEQKLAAASTAPKKEEPKPAAPAVAPAPAAPAPAAAAPAPAPEPAKPAKKLPKTGSPLPLVGLSGGLFLALGAGLSALRRRAA